MTTNPERLYAFFVRGAVYAGTSRGSVEAGTAFGWGATPISGYVREDGAEATANALRRERDALRSALEQTMRAIRAERRDARTRALAVTGSAEASSHYSAARACLRILRKSNAAAKGVE